MVTTAPPTLQRGVDQNMFSQNLKNQHSDSAEIFTADTVGQNALQMNLTGHFMCKLLRYEGVKKTAKSLMFKKSCFTWPIFIQLYKDIKLNEKIRLKEEILS